MSEATFDRDGYPTGDYLLTLREWPVGKSYVALLELAAEGWYYPDFVDGPTALDDGETGFTFVTGGWSGNESIIEALQDNFAFWASCWQSSHRGGKHEFAIPKCLHGKPEGSPL